MRTVFIVAAGILILVSVQCRAESYSDSLYNLAYKACYEDADYEKAAFYAFQAIEPEPPKDKWEEVKFRDLLAYAYVALGQNDFARKEFVKILKLFPTWQKDPQITPRKVLEVFEEARRQYEAYLALPPAKRLSPSEVRFGASWRSLVLPGWGQFYKGQKARGAVVASLQILSLATLAVLQTEVNRRHNVYEDKEGNEAITAYDEYSRVWRARNVVGYVALGIYIGAYLDALYTSPGR